MKIFLLVYFFKIKINIEIYNRKSIKRKTHLHVHSIGLLPVNHQQFLSLLSADRTKHDGVDLSSIYNNICEIPVMVVVNMGK